MRRLPGPRSTGFACTISEPTSIRRLSRRWRINRDGNHAMIHGDQGQGRGDRRRLLWMVGTAVAVTVTLGTIGWCVRDRHAMNIEARLDAFRELIWHHAERAALPSELVRSIIRAESGGDPTAVSVSDAKGLMQIRTAAEDDALKRLGRSRGDLFDPDYNILIGTTYLALLRDRFGEDWVLVTAAYHQGPTRTRQLMDAHPDLGSEQLLHRHVNPTTRAYVQRVLGG